MLTSERLILREFSDSDFEQVHSYAADNEVTRYMEWGPNTEKETKGFLLRARLTAEESPRKLFELAVIEIETGHLVGGIGLHTSGFQAMLGYCFSRPTWGNGYATEAARILIGFGFSSLGLHRVWARCDSENNGSLRVLAKLGMRREGLARHDCQIRGVWRNTFLYAILVDEWNNRSA